MWGRQVARNKARPVACRWGEEDTAAGLWGLQHSFISCSSAQAWGSRALQAHTRGSCTRHQVQKEAYHCSFSCCTRWLVQLCCTSRHQIRLSPSDKYMSLLGLVRWSSLARQLTCSFLAQARP